MNYSKMTKNQVVEELKRCQHRVEVLEKSPEFGIKSALKLLHKSLGDYIDLVYWDDKKVTLINYGDYKIDVIKAIRKFCDVGLKEAKEIAETPNYVFVVDKSDELFEALSIAGAHVKKEY